MFRSTVVACAFLCGSAAWAQSIISAHSGVIHYIEGDVSIDGTNIHPKFAQYPEVKEGQVLATDEGRAEVLLTPGVFLRLAEDSSVRMISNSLADTRLEVLSGSALVEVGELLDHNAVTLETRGVQIELPKRGLYRMDADSARLRVYDGQALVIAGSQKIKAKKKHEIALDTDQLADAKFDPKKTDPFYRWSARRANYIAAANIISARTAARSGYSSSLLGGQLGWNWNPWFGMYTFTPATGMYWSPFGSPFYNPGVVTGLYYPRRAVFGGPSMSGGPGAGSAAAPVAPAPSMGGSGTRGGFNGGRFSGGGRSGGGMPHATGTRGR
jgi:hypothetical protein